jgi:hypothetical protein
MYRYVIIELSPMIPAVLPVPWENPWRDLLFSAAADKKDIRNVRVYFFAAALILCCICILPVSAEVIAPEINQGAVIYIGEEGLNLTHALNQAHGASDVDGVPGNTGIGWWPSGGSVAVTAPTKTLNISSRYRSFTVEPSDFVGYSGNWYPLDNSSGMIDLTNGGEPHAAFVVSDPNLDLQVWDFNQGMDRSGMSVPRGQHLGFKLRTNMYEALDERYRAPVTPTEEDGYITIKVRNESGSVLGELATGPGEDAPLSELVVTTTPWFWPSADGSVYWQTDAKDADGNDLYPAGTYTVWAESVLNNMKNNYRNAGADYVGKTMSWPRTITLVPDALKIECSRDAVIQDDRFSVTITGRPATKYYLWIKDDGGATLPVSESPPSILPSARVLQDLPDGPFVIGSHLVLNGAGKTIRDVVPPSTLDKTLYYAAVVTSSGGTATVGIQPWNATRPA